MLPRNLGTLVSHTPVGAMKHQIILLSNNPTQNADGSFGTPETFGTSWAMILALQGRDLNLAQQIVSTVTHKIVVPWQSGISSSMVVSYGTRTFQINAVQDPDESQFELWLLCTETNDGGS
jgi:SPP1 family predicted phage head-tail adaptor